MLITQYAAKEHLEAKELPNRKGKTGLKGRKEKGERLDQYGFAGYGN
jgi:hypothetical protein